MTPDLLPVESALQRLLDVLPASHSNTLGFGVQKLPLRQCQGRYLAEELRSPINLPSFDNSSMDGWAVRSAEIARVPVRLKIQGELAAGEWPDQPLENGHVFRVFTGSPLPTNADAVVMQEDAAVLSDGWLEILEIAKPWENIRLQGEDLRAGTPLMPVGTRLGAAQLALLAGVGFASVSVSPALNVAILPNGSELTPPGAPLRLGAVYESNSTALASLVESVGANAHCIAPPPDDLTSVTQALESAFSVANVVITAGGASVGDHDLVKPAFEKLGGQLQFWRIAMKPGKPFFFGTRKNSSGTLDLLLGVPGNPVSAFVTTVVLVLPVLRRLLGASIWENPIRKGVLSEPIQNPENRRHYMRVNLDSAGRVRLTGPQASHMLSSLAAANGLLDVAPRTAWPAGTEVPVIQWEC